MGGSRRVGLHSAEKSFETLSELEAQLSLCELQADELKPREEKGWTCEAMVQCCHHEHAP